MNRKLNDGLLVIVLALLALGAYVATRPAPQPPAPVVVPVPAPAPAPVPAPQPGPVPPQDKATVGERSFPTGYIPNQPKTNEYINSLEKPTIREAGPELFKDRTPVKDAKGVFLYRSLVRQYQIAYGRPWIVDTQEIGDCVSFGYMHAVAILLALDVELGRSERFLMPDTSGIYGGSRVEARGSPGDGARAYGGYGDGSYGSAATEFVTKWGVLFRQPYERFDLTKYTGSRSKEWGAYGCGGKGDGGKADEIAREHPIKQAALVVSFDEAVAAITSGYPVPVCSGQGFTSTRDKNGFCSPRGSWSHCMCFVACRTEPPGLLCLNSWGPNWVGGPKFPDDQPDGSFWVDPKTATNMLSGRDSFALASIKGFPFRDLNNGDWIGTAPKPVPQAEESFVLAP